MLITSVANASTWLPGVKVIPDAWRKQGSLVGIHTALTFARSPILLVAWDMPFVTRDLFSLLCDRSTASQYATIPHGATTLEPFCAVYTPECLPVIEERLAADDLRLANMLDRLPSFEKIEVSDIARVGDPIRLFFNVNTAEDLAIAEVMAAAN